MPDNPRLMALKALVQVLPGRPNSDQEKDGLSLTAALQQIEGSVPPLTREICYGVCRHYGFLDRIICKYLQKPLKERDHDLYLLLVCGAYQLLMMRTPDHAVVNESVNTCKLVSKPWASGLVNSILRKVSDESERLLDEKSLTMAWNSHPAWLVDRLAADWPGDFRDILQENQQRPPMAIRANLLQTTPEALSEKLAEEGIEARAGQYAKNCIYVNPPVPVDRLPGFASGSCSVQDEAAQLAVEALLEHCEEGTPQKRVLDACAAPGGKTGYLAEALHHNHSDILALDSSQKRLEQVHDNLQRLDLKATVLEADATQADQWWDGKPFDLVLLDAPCSGTGVIRRHPDIKWLRRDSDIPVLVRTQQALLSQLWTVLAPGGYLVYATCSVLRDENENVAKAFLGAQNDAIEDTIHASWGLEVSTGRQLLPQGNGPDGFYIARFRKAEQT